MTQHDIIIRIGSTTDAALLAELGARTFFDTFAGENTAEDMAAYLAETFGPELQAAELAEIGTTFLIAEIDGVPAGYARLHIGATHSTLSAVRPIEVVRLYVDMPWIGRGVGPALMDASLRHATERGCDVIWLGVWERNFRAMAFYRKWGFAIVGDTDFRLGGDLQHDFVMQRSLTSA